MEMEKYFSDSEVSFHFVNDRYSYKPGDNVIGIENILGKVVWVCDYHNGSKPFSNPVRNLPPTQVVICPMSEATFPNTHPFCPIPIFFKKMKNGKITNEEICPFDKTSKARFVKIFDSESDCLKEYKNLLLQAKSEVKDFIEKGEKKLNLIDKFLRQI